MQRLYLLLVILAFIILPACKSKDDHKIAGIKIYDYNGDYAGLVSKWKDIGINTCFLSTNLAADKGFRKILHKNKIRVYIIFPVFQNPEILRNDSSLYSIKNDGTIAKDDWVRFVCPSRSSYRIEKTEELADLIRDLNPDGISIDFIRQFVYWEMIYPDREPGTISSACFCDSCISEFLKENDLRLPDTCMTTARKADFLMVNHMERWDSFRCSLITSMVKKLAEKARSIKPDIKINVHAVPWRENDFSGALVHVAAQDLGAITPLADYVSPMCYSQMLKRDARWIAGVVEDMDRSCRGKILPSIQVYPEYIDNTFTPDDLKDCIEEAIKPPSLGVVFFSWPLFEKDPARMEIAKESLKKIH
jgi:hypothetical protein